MKNYEIDSSTSTLILPLAYTEEYDALRRNTMLR